MKKKVVFLSIPALFIAACSIVLVSNLPFSGRAQNPLVYEGSDPKGDYIEIRIDRALNQITHINHTTGGTVSGPFTYSAMPQGPDTGGFSNMYTAGVGIGKVDHIVFTEYDETAIVYHQFDGAGDPIGNPEYAVISRPLSAADLYETAYNWMQFDARNPIEYSADMQCGFMSFDAAIEGGLMYGVGYSKKAESDPMATNGMRRLTGQFAVDDLQTNLSSGSRYINLEGGIGMEDKLVMIGTPSDSLILDFGPGISYTGGSGLMVRQSSTPGWDPIYNGTYYVMIYRHATASSDQEINHYKLVLSGGATGHLDVYEFADNISTAIPIFSCDLTALSDLDPAHSPGGVTSLIDQFEAIAENNLAVSPVVQESHRAYGAYSGGDSTTNLYLMFEPGGAYGGLSSIYSDGVADDTFEFGFMIKDPLYSDAGLISFPRGEPECILPIPPHEQGDVFGVQEYNNVADRRHEGIDFMFNDWPPPGSTPDYTLHDIVAPCDGMISRIRRETDTMAPGYSISFGIKYNNDWQSIVVLETYSHDASIEAVQNGEVLVGEGDLVSQGDLLARFVVSESSTPNPTIHWGIYRGSGAGPNDVCPYEYSTVAAKAELEAIFLRVRGAGYTICLPSP